ncbi:MAG: hypothetical protein PHY47_07440 [Lachnospiraceae bacterium]|nr:hypothetical protein [Lachnospiraceae bacterium]
MIYRNCAIILPCPQNVRTIIYPSVLKFIDFEKKYENQIYYFSLDLKASELRYVYGINSDIDNAIEHYIKNTNEKSELRYKLELPVIFSEYIKLYSRLFHTIELNKINTIGD